MGSFIGHLVPGTAFSVFGLWFASCILQRFFLCARVDVMNGSKYVGKYRSTCSFACPCNPAIPLEGIIKIIASIIAISGEFVTAFEGGKFEHIGNAQHMMMYLFFIIHGAADLAVHYKAAVPPEVDYLTAACAFFMESLLFFTHLHGRSLMDIQVHTYIAFVALLCGFAMLLEASFKSSVVLALSRAFFILLQGTWFLQISFLLFSPLGSYFDRNNHEHMMLVTCIFTGHVALDLLLIVILGVISHRRVRNMSSTAAYHTLHSYAHPATFSKFDPIQVKHIIAGSDEEDP
ncbi:transmembrane protein 45B-like [Palaemon carinicauda]|uniref:transmembrane protein 45B-like n=1 Tax=Palaemon carinicauda TaxID=392227 RepID=UPI0035B5900F